MWTASEARHFCAKAPSRTVRLSNCPSVLLDKLTGGGGRGGTREIRRGRESGGAGGLQLSFWPPTVRTEMSPDLDGGTDPGRMEGRRALDEEESRERVGEDEGGETPDSA